MRRGEFGGTRQADGDSWQNCGDRQTPAFANLTKGSVDSVRGAPRRTHRADAH